MKILVADDEIHMLEFMSEFLGKINGHEVVLVENPTEGLDRLTDDCDIVITDYGYGVLHIWRYVRGHDQGHIP